MSAFSYFTVSELLAIHDAILERTGGLAGIRDEGLILGCLDFIQNDTYYPTFEDKLVHLVYTIAKNHAFTDANKRTSIGAGVLFLALNNFDDEILDIFVKKMEALVLHVVENDFSKSEFHQIVSDYITIGDLSATSLAIYQKHHLDPNEQPE